MSESLLGGPTTCLLIPYSSPAQLYPGKLLATPGFIPRAHTSHQSRPTSCRPAFPKPTQTRQSASACIKGCGRERVAGHPHLAVARDPLSPYQQGRKRTPNGDQTAQGYTVWPTWSLQHQRLLLYWLGG